MFKKPTLLLLIFIGHCFFAQISFAQNEKNYLNQKLTTEERVDDLVSKLTLDQKIKLLQYKGSSIKTNDLDIPAYNWWNECLHGVARAGRATVFPQAIGLSATWNAPFIEKVASAISDEARAKYDHFSALDKRGMYQGLNFWTPNINIFRDPRWGRGMETYGEDPFLTGTMASSFIKGLQGNDPNYFKTIATVKHFVVHSGPEQTRHRFNAEVTNLDFFETYTPAFKIAIQDAGVYSLMCAYNSFRGEPCCGSSYLLEDILRKRWGFNGFIVTDCGAVDDFFKDGTHEIVHTPEEASALAIKAGVSLECGDIFNALDKAVEKKLVTEAELDIVIKRLFAARFRLGMFDKKGDNPFDNIPYSVVESTKHQELSLQAARESIVLLKNGNAFLPLNKSVKTIAVIGPNSNDEEVMLANYNGFPTTIITPLQGIKNKIPKAKVLYARGSAHAEGAPSLEIITPANFFQDASGLEPGLHAKYYNNISYKGEPVISRVDEKIDFNWMDNSPIKNLNEEDFSAKWSGYIKIPVSGEINFNMFGAEEYELLIDGKSQFSFSSIYSPGYKSVNLNFKKGEIHKIDIKYASRGANAQLKLSWGLPDQNLKLEALKIARQADVVIMCMGLSPRLEGEEMDVKLDGFDGGDRTEIVLPKVQQDLIKEVKALGKPVVLVLLNGSALGLKWEDENLPAIVEAWYGGQKGGEAIADVLFGDYNPSGKLPVTFYASVDDLPAFDNYDMKGRTYKYYQGTPVYKFGYGLSYTKFSYDKLITKEVFGINEEINLSVDVENIGEREGDEVVQVYLKHLDSKVAVPLISLKAFQKIHLNKGEKKTISFTLKPSDFSVIVENGDAVVNPGKFEVFLGGGQPNGKNSSVLSKEIELKKEPKSF
ncbi:glucan 1,4-alpha-glucosidase [Flavobacterium circumlabens]|uniref:Beta-glucosidase n=1 Tax=Flavobacterium circumlabens TaxID=2133765 RepID=A0A4Y7UEG3_9FLAO|nr:glycoside hydrolase family 3 C-terminal domain-containing protein [Flavobacterium circumlabens]TCN59565.1 beta-glucosidase [Flavobacterium circumlabens]TEB44850.1 glucan 1,4-alpha-glucosidase [Flavobacterium circumlabens]